MTSRQNPSYFVVRGRRRQGGAFAIMLAPLLIVLIGFCGLALDMGHIYNRRVDLHGVAKAAALAAARELNGTPEGITAARNAARTAATALRYKNFAGGIPVTWNDEALSFGASAARTGTWVSSLDAGGSASTAAGLYFARVDTTPLDTAIGTVSTFFIKIIASHLATIPVSESAIAGHTATPVMPIGVCAMSTDPAGVRVSTGASGAKLSELVQYGFRRGVSYDLMRLNPSGTEPARFSINPIAEPGTNAPQMSTRGLVPFVCKGALWIRRLGGTVKVSSLDELHPLVSLSNALNTRFNQYGGTPCDPSGAEPDQNIKQYAYNQTGNVRWMAAPTGLAAADMTTANGRLETVADLATAPASAGKYGPLWSYAKAAKMPAMPGSAEPPEGYATFATADWSTLYPAGASAANAPAASNYPALSPYLSSLAAHVETPVANLAMAKYYRRLLYIPLLACSPAAPAGTNVDATLLAVARFFMTVPATDDSLIAEFAGSVAPQAMPGHLELFP